jgi:hypothetical protein
MIEKLTISFTEKSNSGWAILACSDKSEPRHMVLCPARQRHKLLLKFFSRRYHKCWHPHVGISNRSDNNDLTGNRHNHDRGWWDRYEYRGIGKRNLSKG